jgi:hypothetical protein
LIGRHHAPPVLAQGTNDLGEAVRVMAELLSIPTGDRYPPLDLTPQKRKEKRLHAQVARVEGLAPRRPARTQLNALCSVVLSFQAAPHRDPG